MQPTHQIKSRKRRTKVSVSRDQRRTVSLANKQNNKIFFSLLLGQITREIKETGGFELSRVPGFDKVLCNRRLDVCTGSFQTCGMPNQSGKPTVRELPNAGLST
jgi:hypothetical protein